jgi:hypothetical protein
MGAFNDGCRRRRRHRRRDDEGSSARIGGPGGGSAVRRTGPARRFGSARPGPGIVRLERPGSSSGPLGGYGRQSEPDLSVRNNQATTCGARRHDPGKVRGTVLRRLLRTGAPCLMSQRGDPHQAHGLSGLRALLESHTARCDQPVTNVLARYRTVTKQGCNSFLILPPIGASNAERRCWDENW